MFSTLEGQAHFSESTVESLGSSAVELFVERADINPGVETARLPHLLPGALILQTETEVPVRPGAARVQTDNKHVYKLSWKPSTISVRLHFLNDEKI